MNQHDVEPMADVRAFLPRPGEPVETYAERLRALHRDLTLVLQAVERGLSAGEARPEDESFEEDAGAHDVAIEPEPEPIEVHGITPAASEQIPASAVRVEVLPARSDAPRRSGAEHSPPWSEDTPIERRAPLRPVVAPPPEPRREPVPPPRREIAPPPPVALPPAPPEPPFYARPLPSWVIAAVLAGWLTIVALLIALLVES
jgi:hypothetical protein